MKQLTEGCTDAAQEDTGHYGQRHEEAALHSPAGFKSWPCLISISRFVTSAGPLATKTKQNTVATMALIPLIFYFKQFKFSFKNRDVEHSKHFYLRTDKEMQVTHERAGRRLTAGRIVYFSFRSGLKLRPPTPPLLRNATGTFRDHFVFFLLLQIGVSVHPFDTLTSYSTASPF